MAVRSMFFILCSLVLLTYCMASAAIVEHSFYVQNHTVERMCRKQVITTVNGTLPGPTVYAREGDSLVIHVHNVSPYNITIHWHGIFQLLSAWADGPSYITQCPITPGNSYTYRFKIIGQEGTLWWHAHFSMLRATVYGALIIYPKQGRTHYPFPKPYKEVPILLGKNIGYLIPPDGWHFSTHSTVLWDSLFGPDSTVVVSAEVPSSGEWWNRNVIDVDNQALALGVPPSLSDAFSINGKLGDFYNCSKNETYKLRVIQGKTYLLRVINAAVDNQLFFRIANHNFKVVAVDASYTNPYTTDVLVIAPGQTVDALLVANQVPSSYYIAARSYFSALNVPAFANTTTTAILIYKNAPKNALPKLPLLPAFNDTLTAHKFYSNLTSLVGSSTWVPVQYNVDETMFITVGLGLSLCGGTNNCVLIPQNPALRFSASLNNHSFIKPSTTSLLEASFFNVSGIYTADFPNKPPFIFDYTNTSLAQSPTAFAFKSTSVKKLKYNVTVEIVFQNTAFIGLENHPMHLHGFNFHVMAQGFGNYNPVNDRKKFNYYNPQTRNTIGVPVGGWAVIRFQANNPGVWFLHCHLDAHLPLGLATAFVVEDGPTPSTKLPPPPPDLSKC